ncbi:MAG: SPOR domain-containing protein [Xanthomonadales bacterium]|nr:SPOR domain-containing protein [Xanthomonadales bacterium]
MDPTLKRRLVGAAVLIVLAAIVLPMFLAGPPPEQRRTETLPLQIPPAPDRELARVELPLTGDVADADRVVTVDTASQAPAPVAAPDPAAAAAPPEPAPVTAAPPATTPATAPAPVTPTPAQASAPAPAAAGGGLPATEAGGRFWVSLGSYGQTGNADRVEAAARRAGAAVAREQVQSGGRSLVRLRAGPWQTRAQAEQARQRLLTAVPDAQPKVEEDASGGAPVAAAPTAPQGAGAFAVQVGAFAQEATARQLGDRLRGAGYPAFVVRRGDSHAVRVGPYTRRDQAQAQLERLKSSQRLDGLVVPHP